MRFSVSGEGARGPEGGAKGSCGTPGPPELAALVEARAEEGGLDKAAFARLRRLDEGGGDAPGRGGFAASMSST